MAALALGFVASHAQVAYGASAAARRPDLASPEIRTSANNHIPACVTPERLMAFLKSRNPALDTRYADIAKLYRQYGEAWHVRWDYAVFQMAVETNSLQFLRGDGSPGDVKPRQNNFAGIGTTGGGVPGDSFPDVKTGVLAHIEHLVAYSGEKLAHPVAPRTQLKQADIVEASLALNRPVRFADLARRWATDAAYWRSIETLADAFRTTYCTQPEPATAAPQPQRAARPPTARDGGSRPAAAQHTASRIAAATPATDRSHDPVHTLWRAESSVASAAAAPAATPQPSAAPSPAQLPTSAARETAAAETAATSSPAPSAAAPAAVPVQSGPACSIASASYGGSKTLLIRSTGDTGVHFTALSVLEGFEDAMAQSFIRTHAPGGVAIGAYPSRADALSKARALCAAGA